MARKRRANSAASGKTNGKRATATATGRRGGGDKQRFAQINSATSQIVRQAAELLDEEVAAGIVTAKQMQDRFARERRVDPADLQVSLQRFQADAHEVVTMLDQQLAELRSDDNAALVSRLVSNAHDLVDVLVGVVNMGADIANQLAEKNLDRPGTDRPRPRRG
jgi:hypothetical protein